MKESAESIISIIIAAIKEMGNKIKEKGTRMKE